MTRQTGFGLVVKQIIRDRATVEFDGVDVIVCEVRQECEGAAAEHLHHRRPRQRGGSRRPDTNMPSNSLAACAACHAWIESDRSAAYDNGWLVHQGESPSETPVLYRGALVLLDDLGGVEPVAVHDDSPIKSAAQRVNCEDENGPEPVRQHHVVPDLTTGLGVAND